MVERNAEVSVDLSVVIPLYNEEENVRPLLLGLFTVLETLPQACEVIVIDDGSSDGSFVALQELAQNEKRLKVIRFRRNFGQTAALMAGFDLAQGDIVVTMDADLQNDPADIPLLLDKIAEGYDVVSGWRIKRQDPFLSRRLPSQTANWLIGKTTGLCLHDYGCSLKAYRLTVVKNIHLYGELHRFIPALASGMGVRVAEVPVHHAARRFGRSKYNLSRTPRVVIDLITVRFLLQYGTRPAQAFSLLGVWSFGVGLVLGLYLAFLRFIMGHPVGNSPFWILCMLLCMGGVQMVLMGLLGELMMRTYYETQHKPIYMIRQILNVDGAEKRLARHVTRPDTTDLLPTSSNAGSRDEMA